MTKSTIKFKKFQLFERNYEKIRFYVNCLTEVLIIFSQIFWNKQIFNVNR